jgi:anti-sigma B factor antagonist
VSTSPITQQPTQFFVEGSSANRETTITCSGRLVVNTASAFAGECRKWTECSSSMIVDVGGLTYMDSAGLGALVGAYTSAKKAGCEFQLLHVTPRIMHLLQLTNLDKVLQPTTENLL